MKIDVRGLTDGQQAQIVLDMYMSAKHANNHPLAQVASTFLSNAPVAAMSAMSLQASEDITVQYILSSAFYVRNDGIKVILIDRLKGTPIKTTHSKRGGVIHLDFALYKKEYGADALKSVHEKLGEYKFLNGRIFAFNPDRELRLAAKEGNLAEVKMLVEDDGANPNALALNGRAALHFAVSNKHPDVVQYLMLKTDCSITDVKGKTPLAIANDQGFADIASILSSASKMESDIVAMGNDGSSIDF